MAAIPKSILLVAVLGCAMLPAVPVPADATGAVEIPAPPALVALRDELAARVDEGAIGALSVVAIDAGAVVWSQGFGLHEDSGRAVSVHTLYPVASVSKSLVGLAAAILIEEGRLSLEDRVNARLKSFQVAHGSWVEQEIRVVDLAGMTAGMEHGGISWLRPPADPVAASRRVVRAFAVVDETPGANFRYSNYSSGILECVVGDVAGESLVAFLRRRVFDPLGMRATSPYPEPGNPALAAVHSGAHVLDPHPLMTPLGGQGFYSSAADLARFAQLHLRPAAATQFGCSAEAVLLSRHPSDRVASGPGGYWMGWGGWVGNGTRFEMTNGQGWDATACILLAPEHGSAVICLSDTQWNDAQGNERVADAVAMRTMDLLHPGCRDGYLAAAADYEASLGEASAVAAAQHPSDGRWRGELRFEGTSHVAALSFADSTASLEFAGLRGHCADAAVTGPSFQLRFTAEGTIEMLGELATPTSMSLSLRVLSADRLVGSVQIGCYDLNGDKVGTGVGLVELERLR